MSDCFCGNTPEKLFTGPGWRLFGCQRCNVFGLEPTWAEARESWQECSVEWAGQQGKVRSYHETKHPGYVTAAVAELVALRDGHESRAKQLSPRTKWRPVDDAVYPSPEELAVSHRRQEVERG